MRRSQYRRETRSRWFSGRRRIAAGVATLVAFGGIVTVTQVSDASTRRSTQRALAACNNLEPPESTKLSSETRRGTYTTNRGRVTQHADDGSGDVPTAAEMRSRCRQWVLRNTSGGSEQPSRDPSASVDPRASTSAPADPGASAEPGASTSDPVDPSASTSAPADPGASVPADPGAPADPGNDNGNDNDDGDGDGGTDDDGVVTPPPGAGLGILTNNCESSNLEAHDGFQNGGRCVSTQFGEVGSEANNPSLLITEAPEQVAANTPFTLKVSTRNLIRDRFLAAGQGGYYVESSVLQDGIVRGHFHTACRMLDGTDEAPAPEPVPAFFVATEDQKGGRDADTVTIQVAGLPDEGLAQCASWAGDGSHRIPMTQRANQTPAFDAVRIQVGGDADEGDQADDQQQGN